MATVSPTGLVTGIAAGSATIRGISEGKSGSASVLVRAPAASVVIEPGEMTLAPSETAQLSVVVLDAEENPLTDRAASWSSSHPDVASVSGTGMVTARTDGTTTVTATVEGKTGSAVITVVTASLAQHWLLHETLSDENLGDSCENFQ